MNRVISILTLLIGSQMAVADGHSPTEIMLPKDTYSLEGELMNVELTDTGGTVTVSGNQGQYGKVYITYNMSLSPNSTSQGSFTGKAMAIDNDGNRNAAIRGGVWKREGNKMTMHSLDDVTDGNQFLCKSILDLRTGKFEMTFYGM